MLPVFRQVPEICRPCLGRLARQAARLACGEGAEDLALSWLEELYRPDVPPPVVASALHRRLRRHCRHPDPYLPLKEREIALAREVAAGVRPRYGDSFAELVLFSLLGNVIDFFRPEEELRAAFAAGVRLALDHRDRVRARLERAQRVLFLPDNAGEVFFDLPLLAWLKRGGWRVCYAVKPRPIQNDLSLEDLERMGVEVPVEVVTTGADTVGLSLAEADPGFRRLFHEADLVLAKGMGHYETLSPVSHPGLVFLLCAKCEPVARSLGVPLGAHVVLTG